MSLNASKDLIDLIDSRITAKKYQRVAIVESVSEDNKTAVVRFPETDTTFEFYNKTGEVLTEKDSVYITSNDGDLMNGYIQNRFGESSWLKVGSDLEVEPGAIGEDELAEGSVTAGKIADFSVTNAHIVNASITNAKIQNAAITNAKIENATITTAKIQDAAITNAKIENAAIDNAKIGIAAIDTANIKDLAVKRACIDVEAVGTSQIADGSITDAKIVSLTAEKVVSGIIDTSKVTVLGANGKLRIANNRLQVFDDQTTPVERVSLGDVNGDGTVFGFRVRGLDGTTLLMDETGVKNEGITNGSIDDSKISSDADINGTKLLNDSITGGKLVIDAITAREIAAKTITANEIVADTITSAEIAAGAITADEIAANAVTAMKIKAGEVTTDHIAPNFGETLDITANSAVTDLDGRLTSAELKVAPDAIVATVTGSSAYTADLAEKANTSDLTDLDSRIDSAELKITPTAITSTVRSSSGYTTDLAGKVGTGSYTSGTIMSMINQDASSVTIVASKINLSGYATFTDAQSYANTAQSNAISSVKTGLGSSGYTTIHGGNITTGSIVADKIAANTITSSKIYMTGLLNGYSSGQSTGFTINSVGQISVGGGNISFGSYGAMIQAASSTLNIYNLGNEVIIQSSKTGIDALYARTQPLNIPWTSESTSTKISKFLWNTSGYIVVSTPAGDKGISVGDSDRRLKTNISDSTINATDTIQKIRTKSFNWIKDGKYVDCGLIAQEVEQDLGERYVLKVEQPDGDIRYQMQPYEFVPLLLKGIQELDTQLKKSTNEINVLKVRCDLQDQAINELRKEIELLKNGAA